MLSEWCWVKKAGLSDIPTLDEMNHSLTWSEINVHLLIWSQLLESQSLNPIRMLTIVWQSTGSCSRFCRNEVRLESYYYITVLESEFVLLSPLQICIKRRSCLLNWCWVNSPQLHRQADSLSLSICSRLEQVLPYLPGSPESCQKYRRAMKCCRRKL